MKIKINDLVGLSELEIIELTKSLLKNRKPEENQFDYGFETHGVFAFFGGIKLPYPIQVFQSNKRKSAKSQIIITIEKHIHI